MGHKEENRLGLLGATAYIVGSIVGSGIFVSPKGILKYAGSVGLSLIIWVVCAVLSMLTAVNYIELGTSIPESGAELAYIAYVGWYPIAFSFLWLSTVVQSSCSGAVLFLTFGQYIVEAINSLICLHHSTQQICIKLFGFGLLFLLTISNMYSLRKIAGRIQILSMFSKIATLAWIIGIGGYCMIFKGSKYTAHFKPSYAFSGTNWNASDIVLAIYQGNWAYGRVENGRALESPGAKGNYGTEDVQIKNFRQTLPRAVIGGLAISSIVYVLANVAYFSVLSPQQIMGDDAVAMNTLGQGAAYVVPALVGLLIIGTLNSDVFTWSRFMLAGARKKMLPTAFALVHPENDSPRVAVLTHTLLCVGFSFIGSVDSLVDYLTIVGIMCTCFALLALILIKWKGIPVAKNAVKFNIFWPILNLLINIALLVIPFIQDWEQSVIGLGLFLGGCAYFLFVYPPKKPRFLYTIDRNYNRFLCPGITDVVTKYCQLLFWTVVDTGPEYQKESTQLILAEVVKKEPEFFVERF